MKLLRIPHLLWQRVRTLFRRNRVEQELDRELQFHFDQQVDEYLARGMSLNDARNAAKRSLGGIAQVQEECRDMRQTNRIDTLLQDLRYAARTLSRAPGFTVVIVLTLALSIGANSAIFSVIQGVLLKPLPYPQPDRLVRIYFKGTTQPKFPMNPNDLRDFRSRNRTFDGIAGMTRNDAQLSGSGDPLMLRAFDVTAGYFKVLGLTPAMGREFETTDETTPPSRYAIISDRLWRNRFASDQAILGRSVVLDAIPHTIIGVMPPGAKHPGNTYHAVEDGDSVDVWRPFAYGNPKQRGGHFMDGFGRLKPGVSLEQGIADLKSVLAQVITEYPAVKGWDTYAVPLHQELVGRTERMLFVLLGAVGLLLLIACVNAANLLLARGGIRVREIAVRSALGASRGRIIRQLLTESVLISLAAAAAGTLLAWGGVKVLAASLPEGFPRASEIRLDLGVFGFTLALAVLTGLLFGLMPALTAAKTNLQDNLRSSGRGSSGDGKQSRMRSLLVVGETGLACVLLIGAGLMLHSFVNLVREDPGFRPQNVISAAISLPRQRYKEPAQRTQFYDRLTSELMTLPQAQAAGVGSDLPWTGYDENAGGFRIEGHAPDSADNTTARYHMASPDYFRALGMPLLRGRFFTPQDDANAPSVIIINETLANRYMPGEDPVGKRMTFARNPKEKNWMRIVGVVSDVRDQPEQAVAHPAFWMPVVQQPISNVLVTFRSSADPGTLPQQLRETIRRLDPELALSDLRSLDQVANAAFSGPRFALFLVGLFAVLALALATFGMYGVISYSVNQRMSEFGLRMALGAKPGDLMKLILLQGLGLATIGALLGVAGAIGLGRLLEGLLYGVKSTDPLTSAAVVAVALVTAALACYLPARRAASVDPMFALRSE
jgi:predicted permease